MTPALAQSIGAWLNYTVRCRPIRDVARFLGQHPSTVLRRIRRIEDLTDCPAWGQILETLADVYRSPTPRADLSDPTPEAFVSALAPGMSVEVATDELRSVAPILVLGASVALAPDASRAVVACSGARSVTVPRAAALAWLVLGWFRADPLGEVAARLLLSGAGRTIVRAPGFYKCAEPAALADLREKVTATAPKETPSRARRAVALGADPTDPVGRVADLKRRGGLSDDQAYSATRFVCDYMTDPAQAAESVGRALPPPQVDLLVALLGQGGGVEVIEARLGLPARSGKAMLAAAIDTCRHHGVLK